MPLRLTAVAVMAPLMALLIAACSSDVSNINILPKLGNFESLSVGSAVPDRELRPVTTADLVGPQGQCAGSGGQDAALTQGGIALQMTECEVVRRAGAPENIELGST